MMPDKKIDTGPLEKLKGFEVTEPTGIPDLPDLPDPESPEFQAGELGKGIQVARAVSILLAGASDPNLAAALAQQFKQQDLVAKQDAQNRFQIALGTAQAAREEVGFREGARETRVKEQLDVADVRIRAANAALSAAQLEHQMTQDADKREQLSVTIPMIMSLAEGLRPETPKITPAKSVLELIQRGVDPEKVSKAMIKGKGEELLADFNEKLQASVGPTPKALLPASAIEALKAGTSPAGQAVIDILMATVPDPRTDTFGSPADSLTFNSSARKLAEVDPEAHDRLVEQVTQAWVASGRVPDLETAETIFADAEHNGSNPEDDSRLGEEGVFNQGPSRFGQLKSKLSETPRQQKLRRANEALERQGKPEGRF